MKKAVLYVLMSCMLLNLVGCSVKKIEDVTDEEKFSFEYEVDKKNPFKYSEIEEVLDVLENKSGIVLFANPDSEWSVASIKLLTEILIEEEIETVYYYNPKKIRMNNTEEYKKLISILDEHLDDKTLFVPDIYFVVNGEIVARNNDMADAIKDEEKNYTKKKEKELKEKFSELVKEYKEKLS